MLIIVPGRVPIVPINDNNCRRDCGNSCLIRRRGTENKQTATAISSPIKKSTGDLH